MPQNKVISPENWLNNNLRYDEIKNCLENVLSFYGDYCKQLLLSSGTTLFLNDKKNRWALGMFSHFDNSITLHEEFYAVQSENCDWFRVHFSNLYVNEAVFRKEIYPVVRGVYRKNSERKIKKSCHYREMIAARCILSAHQTKVTGKTAQGAIK